MRIRQLDKEQVRKGGLPPLLLGFDERGQAPLPDRFISDEASMRIRQLDKEQVRKGGLPPLLLGLDERAQAPLPDLFFSEGSNKRRSAP
jgi:hypothetical protein